MNNFLFEIKPDKYDKRISILIFISKNYENLNKLN